MKAKRYYTITKAARKLKISRAAVHRAIKQNRLEADWGPVSPPLEGWRIAEKAVRYYRVSSFHQSIGKKLQYG